VLLVHDRYVTGQSLRTTTQALMNHGALGVWGLSLMASTTSHMIDS
jgi:predicted amidophosphoribosyltransferase